MKAMKQKTILEYIIRFTFSHVITYMFCGLIFMNLMGYQKEFLTNPNFSYFRPINSLIVQAAVLFQFFRGGVFALILYPFRKTIINSERGWLMLFWVIWGLTCIGSVNATPGSIEGLIYTDVSLKTHLVGMPEVIIQALAFSVMFWAWDRRSIKEQHKS